MGRHEIGPATEAIDWATAEWTRRRKYLRKVDPAKFAVAGMSCGGLQALEVPIRAW